MLGGKAKADHMYYYITTRDVAAEAEAATTRLQQVQDGEGVQFQKRPEEFESKCRDE